MKVVRMKSNLRILAVALPVWTLTAGLAWADAVPGGHDDHPHMWGEWGWGSMFMGPLFGILLIPVIAVAIVLVVRAIGRDAATDRPEGGSALDILDERFARGEIDVQEYEERKKILTGG
jgi:putative membrane protein